MTAPTIRETLEIWVIENPTASYATYKEQHPLTAIKPSQFDSSKHDILKRKVKPIHSGHGLGKPADFISDKRVGKSSWREMADWMEAGQKWAGDASWSQDAARIEFPDATEPILILPFSDTHMGSWAADVRLFRAFTDEILATPNLYVLLLGDLIEMAIKLRGVGEVTNQILRPDQQMDFMADWLDEIGHKVVGATWENHAIMREESQSGVSMMKSILNRRFVYHDGIGHMDIKVGKQIYKMALTHKFRGNSYLNRTHGPARYMRFEGTDREIAIQGDIHTPGVSEYYDGALKRIAVTCGTLHLKSLYARRHFSLFTQPSFPCFELYPGDDHLIIPYWNLRTWQIAKGMTPTAPADSGWGNGPINYTTW